MTKNTQSQSTTLPAGYTYAIFSPTPGSRTVFLPNLKIRPSSCPARSDRPPSPTHPRTVLPAATSLPHTKKSPASREPLSPAGQAFPRRRVPRFRRKRRGESFITVNSGYLYRTSAMNSSGSSSSFLSACVSPSPVNITSPGPTSTVSSPFRYLPCPLST